MTLSEMEILQSAFDELSKQIKTLSDDNRSSLGHIYDRLTKIETQMTERECQFKRYEKTLENHEVRIRTVEGEIAPLRDMPERLWRVSMDNSKLAGMMAAAGGIGGLVATLMVKLFGD